eukprot:31246-Pelagococcus_subviridis.AAC.17
MNTFCTPLPEVGGGGEESGRDQRAARARALGVPAEDGDERGGASTRPRAVAEARERLAQGGERRAPTRSDARRRRRRRRRVRGWEERRRRGRRRRGDATRARGGDRRVRSRGGGVREARGRVAPQARGREHEVNGSGARVTRDEDCAHEERAARERLREGPREGDEQERAARVGVREGRRQAAEVVARDSYHIVFIRFDDDDDVPRAHSSSSSSSSSSSGSGFPRPLPPLPPLPGPLPPRPPFLARTAPRLSPRLDADCAATFASFLARFAADCAATFGA